MSATEEQTQADSTAEAAKCEPSGPAPSAGSRIADLLVQVGVITADQLRYALRIQAKLPTQRTLVSVLEELRFSTEEQVRQVLRAHNVSVPLGALLVELGHLREADLKTALAFKKEQANVKLGQILVDNHFISEDALAEVLSYQLGFEYLPLGSVSLDPELARRAPTRIYRAGEFVPVERREGRAVVAFADPLDARAMENARKLFGEDLIPAIARRAEVNEAIDRLEAGRERTGTLVNENVIVATANQILADAAKERASDIHLEPMKDRLRIRFRQDGVLVAYKELPLDMAPPLTSRLKIMAGADIAEKRRHQDGRILFENSGSPMDVRVSIYVTIYGEAVVMRLLNNRNQLVDIKDIGMAPRTVQRFVEDALDAPSGVVIITGPTGSGKTTTLYSAINYLNNAQTSIITAEDPVEYVIEGITQCSINPKIALTYEETLKHIVRQDPDVIVIGEIRDLFSAETAIQAALTGHKVLTTFHTEDSIGGLLRLLNMNIEAFLISSTVVSVLAQRLLRRVCPHCAEDQPVTPHMARRLGYEPRDLQGVAFKVGRGCPRCRFMGYKGRVAVFELLVLNEMVKEALISRRTSYEIRRISTETTGLVTLVEDGVFKAASGLTSFDEIIRTLPRLTKPRPIAELRRLLGDVV